MAKCYRASIQRPSVKGHVFRGQVLQGKYSEAKCYRASVQWPSVTGQVFRVAKYYRQVFRVAKCYTANV